MKCCLCRNIKKVVEKKNKLFKKASERFDEDLDVIKVMQSIRTSSNFRRNFMTREQKILLKFDQSNVISLSTSDSAMEMD
jgi:hypothetical protein